MATDKPTGALTDEQIDNIAALYLMMPKAEADRAWFRKFARYVEAIVRKDVEQEGIEGCLVAAKWARKDEREQAANRVRLAFYGAGFPLDPMVSVEFCRDLAVKAILQ